VTTHITPRQNHRTKQAVLFLQKRTKKLLLPHQNTVQKFPLPPPAISPTLTEWLTEPSPATLAYTTTRTRLAHTIEPTLPDIFTLGTKLLTHPSPTETLPAPPLRIVVIGSATTDLLARAIAIATVQESRIPLIHQGLFGAYAQDILTPTSPLYEFAPDLIVILPTWRDLITETPPNTPLETIAPANAATIATLSRYWNILAERLPAARIIQHIPAPPPARLTGIAERKLPASPTAQYARLTQSLIETGSGRVIFLDLARIATERGLRATASDRFWHAAKLPFDQSALPAYVPAFRAALRTALSRQKKALILDLDNTLWGGVIGDDGVANLKLGAGDPPAKPSPPSNPT
jgi:Predicted enzyme involved in methoxymalonyl-ACP biosynthesis